MIIFHSARLHNNCFLWYDGKKQEAFALDILAEIKTQYETFGKARRQISDIILENPAKCCFLSLKEFAAAANTTDGAEILQGSWDQQLCGTEKVPAELYAHMDLTR